MMPTMASSATTAISRYVVVEPLSPLPLCCGVADGTVDAVGDGIDATADTPGDAPGGDCRASCVFSPGDDVDEDGPGCVAWPDESFEGCAVWFGVPLPSEPASPEMLVAGFMPMPILPILDEGVGDGDGDAIPDKPGLKPPGLNPMFPDVTVTFVLFVTVLDTEWYPCRST